MRFLLAVLLVPFLKLTGYRFSKNFRYGVTRWHRIVYKCVDVVRANQLAGLE